MRGIASIAKAVTPALLSCSIVSGCVRGARNPTRTPSRRSLPTSSAEGGLTLTTTSADHTSPDSVAPASSKCASGIRAPSPAPGSTRTSRPLPTSRLITSGTSATRRSPGAVSFGTPTVMKGGEPSASQADQGGKDRAQPPDRGVGASRGGHRHDRERALEEREQRLGGHPYGRLATPARVADAAVG